MARKLKVFSAQLGFVRAVVAAPSRVAALEAWGVRDDLFKRGTAREETDEGLVAEALAAPGEVLRQPIGDAASLLAAAAKPSAKSGAAQKPAKPKPTKPKAPSPPPDRTELEAAEAAVTDAQAKREQALKALDAEQKALDARRSKIEKDGSVEAADRRREAAHAAYDKALRAWKG